MPGFFGYKKACEMFTFVLENKFFWVRTINILANDGLEAISILQKDWTIDLMFLDINMPKMNGFEVLEYMNKYQ